jgi:hypothetical protein
MGGLPFQEPNNAQRHQKLDKTSKNFPLIPSEAIWPSYYLGFRLLAFTTMEE